MPFYTGDYFRDTRHLTPAKHGIYLMLLAHCWDTKGPAPLDEQECAGICNCRSSDEIEALRYILSKYFVRMEDGHYNPRIQKEIEKAEAISHARSDAGKRGYQARAKQLPSKSQASASTPTTTTTTTSTTKDSKTLSGKPDVSALKAEAKAILAFLNSKAGRAYRENDANLDFIVARLREGYTPQECKQVVAKKCREWSADEKMAEYLRPATLFNRTKFNQYAGELVVPQESPNA